MTLNHENNIRKLHEKEVLHLFLPLFVEKSYFTLAMILDFAIPSTPDPPPPPYAPPPS